MFATIFAAIAAHLDDDSVEHEVDRALRVCMRTSELVPLIIGAAIGWALIAKVRKAQPEVRMLLVIAVILLLLAVAGGIAVHPLLFLIAILAVLAFVGGRRGAVG